MKNKEIVKIDLEEIEESIKKIKAKPLPKNQFSIKTYEDTFMEKKTLNKEESSNNSPIIFEPLQRENNNISPSANKDIELIPFDTEFLKRCPICKKKLKIKKVKKINDFYIQEIFCKNKSCNFKKEIKIRI